MSRRIFHPDSPSRLEWLDGAALDPQLAGLRFGLARESGGLFCHAVEPVADPRLVDAAPAQIARWMMLAEQVANPGTAPVPGSRRREALLRAVAGRRFEQVAGGLALAIIGWLLLRLPDGAREAAVDSALVTGMALLIAARMVQIVATAALARSARLPPRDRLHELTQRVTAARD